MVPYSLAAELPRFQITAAQIRAGPTVADVRARTEADCPQRPAGSSVCSYDRRTSSLRSALPKPARYAEIDRAWLETWNAITSGQAPVRSSLDDVTRQINAML